MPHTPVVAFESKQDAITDAESTKDTPAVQEAHLACRQQQLRCLTDLGVVKEIPMHYSLSVPEK
jgi:hypothetical protein